MGSPPHNAEMIPPVQDQQAIVLLGHVELPMVRFSTAQSFLYR